METGAEKRAGNELSFGDICCSDLVPMVTVRSS